MTLGRFNKFLLDTYRIHQAIFIVALAMMLVVDFIWLPGWATFWIMIAWSGVFGVHFMVFRAQAVDEKWAYERMIFDVYRPWDTGHIEEIKNSPFGKSIYRTELGRVDENGKPLDQSGDGSEENTGNGDTDTKRP